MALEETGQDQHDQTRYYFYSKILLENKLAEVVECTFAPEILSPDMNPQIDSEFYQRQLDWYNEVHDNIEFNKEKMFLETHREVPDTFQSPFISKNDVRQSYLRNYIKSEPTV